MLFSSSMWLSTDKFVAIQKQIESFWKNVVNITTFDRGDGIKIRAAISAPINFHHTLVIIPGRGETAHKYAEFMYCTYQKNIKVVVLFARGQGIADRLLRNRQKCHINDLSAETADLAFMIRKLSLKKFGLLAFSLGGLFTLDLIFSSTALPSKCRASLIAPFLWPNTQFSPFFLTIITKLLGCLPIIKTAFTPYGQDYKRIPFVNNWHSHCQARYDAYHDYYKEHPELTIGSPTWGFIRQSINKQITLFKQHKEFPIPVFVQTAQYDHVVSTKATELFFMRHINDHIQPIVRSLPSAYHDVLNESDEIRNPALTRALNFLFGV